MLECWSMREHCLESCACAMQQALLGSSGELQNGHRQGWAGSGSSGEGLQQLGGLRFTMNADRRSGSGQHLPLGSPGAPDRSDAAALSGSSQHGRSESMGSEAHLQASCCTR